MIQRYGIRHDVLKGTPDGEFVSYKDHQEYVKRVVMEAFQAGKRQGRHDEHVARSNLLPGGTK